MDRSGLKNFGPRHLTWLALCFQHCQFNPWPATSGSSGRRRLVGIGGWAMNYCKWFGLRKHGTCRTYGRLTRAEWCLREVDLQPHQFRLFWTAPFSTKWAQQWRRRTVPIRRTFLERYLGRVRTEGRLRKGRLCGASKLKAHALGEVGMASALPPECLRRLCSGRTCTGLCAALKSNACTHEGSWSFKSPDLVARRFPAFRGGKADSMSGSADGAAAETS